MKKILYILIFSISTISFAQNPILFETDWFLIELTVDGENITIPTNNEVDTVPLNFEDFGIITEPCSYYTAETSNISDNSISFDSFTILDATCSQPETRIFEDHYIHGFYLDDIAGEKTFNYVLNFGDNETRMLTITNREGDVAIYGNAALGINKQDVSQFTLYPNPVKNNLIVKSTNFAANLTIEIYDIQGKLLKSQILEFENQAVIDVSELYNGVYFLKIEDGHGLISTSKFVKD